LQQRLYHNYTPAALEDVMVRILSSHNVCYLEKDANGNACIRIKWKYLEQAETLIYRINVYKPPKPFVISKEDIPQVLAKELKDLGDITMKKVMTNVVRRIYETVNHEYFHTNGIYGKVSWRISD
jgi:hypothetical protein